MGEYIDSTILIVNCLFFLILTIPSGCIAEGHDVPIIYMLLKDFLRLNTLQIHINAEWKMCRPKLMFSQINWIVQYDIAVDKKHKIIYLFNSFFLFSFKNNFWIINIPWPSNTRQGDHFDLLDLLGWHCSNTLWLHRSTYKKYL